MMQEHDTDFLPWQNHLCISLDDSLMDEKDLDSDLMEYLTAPPSVQSMNKAMWTEVWEHVCKENDWMEMRHVKSVGLCPYDKICETFADIGHLTSQDCKMKWQSAGKRAGVVLFHILNALEMKYS